ncbi:MAG: PLP-dependent transferase [Candidatus Micrarchaeota archaeon]|nr:PLP-dependent transferase [Candidatus Micrarchaeota archaeon]MDE1833799.1 PLP-dependent transferase [Candidatus Micrarchaeota archaeon]MDE1859591.1 PLP-dependent transferase [Candidatus Micrarchaeota archaeon]
MGLNTTASRPKSRVSEDLVSVARRSDEAVPSHPTFKALQEADHARLALRPVTPTTENYPGEGTVDIVEFEQKLGRLLNIDPKHIVTYTSGMTALEYLVESAAPTMGTVILHSNDEYSGTNRYLGGILPKRGVKSILITDDTTSMEVLREKIEANRPDIIVLETVANGPNMPVVDLDAFFSIKVLKEIDPLIVFDNTLATPTNIHPSSIIGRRGFRTAVVESGMKAYSRNSEMFGVVFTEDEELLTTLRGERITRRGNLSVEQGKALNRRLVNQTREEFDAINRTTARNALELAKACQEAQGDGKVFTVWHPNLSTHPNSTYANLHFPNGATPLFFIQTTDPYKVAGPRGRSRDEIARVLEANDMINNYVDKGHSFAKKRTTVFPDRDSEVIRISAGVEGPGEIRELKEALRESLSTIA